MVFSIINYYLVMENLAFRSFEQFNFLLCFFRMNSGPSILVSFCIKNLRNAETLQIIP